MKKAVELFVFKISMNGLSDALENYTPGVDAPKDLYKAAQTAAKANNKVESLLYKYMEKYDLEFD